MSNTFFQRGVQPSHGLDAFAARQPLRGARQQLHRGALVDPGRVLEQQQPLFFMVILVIFLFPIIFWKITNLI